MVAFRLDWNCRRYPRQWQASRAGWKGLLFICGGRIALDLAAGGHVTGVSTSGAIAVVVSIEIFRWCRIRGVNAQGENDYLPLKLMARIDDTWDNGRIEYSTAPFVFTTNFSP